MIRHYGRSRTDSLSVRSIDMPGPAVRWIIDDANDDYLDTRGGGYRTRQDALVALAAERRYIANEAYAEVTDGQP